MNHFDDENNILERFRSVTASECMPDNKNSSDIFQSINDESNWEHWIDSSGSSDSPPDFYSDDFKLMMEVMRVDDHAYRIEKKGGIKSINMVAAEESKIRKDAEKRGIFSSYPGARLLINPDLPDIPTKEYRNYGRYRDNFVRVMEEHKKSIPIYRKNHPGCKLIFFVMDEAEEYVEVESEAIANKEHHPGDRNIGRRHFPWIDKAFVESFTGSDIDFLVWYMPFKLLYASSCTFAPMLPKVCIFDIKSDSVNAEPLTTYDENRMMSSGI